MNIIDVVRTALTPDVLSKISTIVGEQPDKVGSAMGNIVPVILGAITKKISGDSGSSLSSLLSDVGGGSFGSMFDTADSTKATIESGGKAAQSLFGDSLGEITTSIASESGTTPEATSSMMNFAIPMVASAIGKATGGSFDAQTISGLLDSQKGLLAGLLPAGLAGILGSLGIGSLFSGVSTVAGAAAGAVSTVADATAGVIGNVTDGVSSGVSGVADAASDAIGAVAGGVGAIASGVASGISNASAAATDAVGNVAGATAGAVVGGVGAVASGVATGVSGVVGATSDAVSNVAGATAGAVGAVAGSVASGVSGVAGATAGAVGAVAGGVASGVSGVADAASDVVKSSGLGKWIATAVVFGVALIAIPYFMKNCKQQIPPAHSTSGDSSGNHATGTNQEQQTTTPAKEVMSSNGESLGAMQNITLPDGTALMLPTNGVESSLLAFIKDSTKMADKTTWFSLDRLYFDTGKSTLSQESKEQLNNITAILKAYPNVHLKIGGYTDNTGSAATNIALSTDRANTTMTALTTAGIEATRLAAEGYGPEHPVADNATPEGRQKNRRISVRVSQK